MATASSFRWKGAGHGPGETHLLRELMRTYQVLMGGFARNVGMPASRFLLLRLLANAEADCGVMDLARALGINAAAVTRQVQALEAEGLVVRAGDARDGRRCRVALSEAGRARFAEIHARGHALERLLAERIPQEELDAATATLARIRAFLEGASRA
jgi:DNA-binding MarR family transcriptional regulator